MKELFGEEYSENDYVCKYDDGHLMRPDSLTNKFIKLLEKSDLPRIRFHDLRHSSASFLLSNGFSLKELQEWLGHGDVGTTGNIYAHLQFKAKENMAAAVESKLFFGA